MPPIGFQGSLQSKNKAELKSIATALRLSVEGTNQELQARIKKHLDNHQSKLEDNPQFAGLYNVKGRRRGSEKPASQVIERTATLPASRLAERDPSSPPRNKGLLHAVTAMDTVFETPVKDLRLVSAMLKKPEPPTPRALQAPATPSSLPPLPPSTHNSPGISAVILSKPRELVKKILETNTRPANESVKTFRAFLSNSRNIWSLTAVLEFIYLLAVMVQWQGYEVTDQIKVAYPTGIDDWNVLLHWFIPTLLVPSIVGTLVSFSPAKSEGNTMEFDPLTASIVRLAAQAVYPYERFPLQSTQGLLKGVVSDVDVLGLRWRLVAASMGVAFAFAEAIGSAPKLIVQEMKAYPPPSRQRLIASVSDNGEEEEDSGSEEVD